VVQSLEGFVITPRIVGKSVGLRDVWVLFAIFVGGEIFGFMGVLLALPVAAVAKIFVRDGVAYYQTSALFASPPTSRVPPAAGGEG
jgi:predicted PurR-regulated permease PerM